MHGLYGSVEQSTSSNLDIPGSTPSNCCFSLVFIK